MKIESERPITAAEYVAMRFDAVSAAHLAALAEGVRDWESKTANHGITVRMLGNVLAATDKDLEGRLRGSSDPAGTAAALVDLMECLNDQAAFYKAITEAMTAAAMRLEIVLGRVTGVE